MLDLLIQLMILEKLFPLIALAVVGIVGGVIWLYTNLYARWFIYHIRVSRTPGRYVPKSPLDEEPGTRVILQQGYPWSYVADYDKAPWTIRFRAR